MSSLAAARADNFYHPPEWDPQKIGRNTYQGSKGANQYETDGIIRFELPFNIWCEGCEQGKGLPGLARYISKGTRFNAKKIAVGKYFSTTIWNFNMKCHLCSTEFDIETDPKNALYICKKGLREKIEEFDAKDAETHELDSDEHRKKVKEDPFFKIEHVNRDLIAKKAAAPRIEAIMDIRDRQAGDDYSASQLLRKNHRTKKKKARAEARSQARSSTPLVRLLPHSAEDTAIAKTIGFAPNQKSGFHRNREKTRLAIRSSSIFGDSKQLARKTKAAKRGNRLKSLISKAHKRNVDMRVFGGSGSSTGAPRAGTTHKSRDGHKSRKPSISVTVKPKR